MYYFFNYPFKLYLFIIFFILKYFKQLITLVLNTVKMYSNVFFFKFLQFLQNT